MVNSSSTYRRRHGHMFFLEHSVHRCVLFYKFTDITVPFKKLALLGPAARRLRFVI